MIRDSYFIVMNEDGQPVTGEEVNIILSALLLMNAATDDEVGSFAL